MGNQFGQWLKYHRKRLGMSQREVGEALGVGQTTIANYENDSRFPDQQKLVGIARLFRTSVDELLGAPRGGFRLGNSVTSRPDGYTADKIIESILNREENQVWERIEAEIAAGMALGSVYEEIIQPTLAATGRLWAAGRLSVAEEHLITYLMESFMERARLYYPKASPREISCICAAVPGEDHGVGLRMFRDLLEQAGWATFFLGTNVPTDHFIRFACSFPVDLIALSVMLASHLDSARLMIREIRRTEEIASVPILIGGGLFTHSNLDWKELGADGIASGMRQGVQEAERLLKQSQQLSENARTREEGA